MRIRRTLNYVLFFALFFLVSIPLSRNLWTLLKIDSAINHPVINSLDIPKSSAIQILTNDNAETSTYNWTIDILSIGSNTRPHYQQTQKETFGSHAAVRRFLAVTESHDTEKDCHLKLNTTQVHTIRYFCSKRHIPYVTLNLFRRLFASPQYLERKGSPEGWLCAQKRPMDGLKLLFREYDRKEPLPDYLFLIDDDTYINMPQVLQYLDENGEYYRHGARMIAGCLTRVRWMNFSFPIGGWGLFISRASLERWHQPLYCNHTDNVVPEVVSDEQGGMQQHACRRLLENGIGERDLFQPGMSLLDLLFKYTWDQPYLDHQNWNDAGFCLHSDTAISYFANFYHVTEHATSVPGMGHPRFAKGNFYYEEDRLLGYRGSVRFTERQMPGARKQKKECLHVNNTLCNASAHLCHYVTPDHMRRLHNAR